MAKEIVELRQRLADLQAKGQTLLDATEKEDRDFTAEEQKEWDAIEAEIAEVKAKIGRIEASEARRDTLGVTRRIAPGQYRTNEPNPETTQGFHDLGEFAHAVRRACNPSGAQIDARLMAAPTNFHQGGASSGEGYEVPVEFREQIFEVVSELDEFGPLVDEEPTNAREVKKIADETTPWGSSGVTANWRSEGTQMTASKLSTEPRSVPLHELYAFVLATEELLEDAPRLQARITRKAGEAIAWKKNDAMVWGSGAGQPQGWMNSSALVSVAQESGQAADTIDDQNVLKMYSRLMVIPGDRPFWLTNRDVVPQLATIQIGDQPVWMPPNGLMDAPGGMLLGYPVRWSEHAKSLGDKGDIQLVSPRGYYALRRTAGAQFAQSMHLYFDYNIEAFRWVFRFGGQTHLSAPVSPANGANTKSHFVTLDERAG